jgi:hypothetical protein
MPYQKTRPDFSGILYLLEMLRYFHAIGIYDAVVRDTEEITANDHFEFADLGLELAAPDFRFEEVPLDDDHEPLAENETEMECCGHWHLLYRFGSPEMREYYRLCRLYEHRESIEPEENPFVQKANDYYCLCADAVDGYIWVGFDDDRYTSALLVEICPDEYYTSLELIKAVHDMIEYYKEHLCDIRLELTNGPPVFLPALPAPKGGQDQDGKNRSAG